MQNMPRLEKRALLSSPTMHGEELKYIQEAYDTGWMTTIGSNIDAIEKDIIERDKRDMTRENSPLRQAQDAILVDTSYMNIDEVCKTIEDIAHEKGGRA